MKLLLNKKFMSLIIVFLSACFLILTVGVVITFNRQHWADIELNSVTNTRYISFSLADQLRQSSDDLTRMVRSYAVTGDEKFKHYFYLIRDIRNGSRARPEGYDRIFWDFIVAQEEVYDEMRGERESLYNLMKEAGFLDEELELLVEANRRSEKLIKMEEIAMNAMVGIFQDDEGRFTLKKSPDRELALTILFSEEYHLAKREIMKPINDFLISIDNRTLDRLTSSQREIDSLRNVFVALFLALIVLVPLLGFSIYRYRLLFEIELESSRRELTTLMANIPGMAYRCLNDENWTMIFVSQGCLSLTGYQPEDLLGNKKISYNELILPEYRKYIYELWQQKLKSRRSVESEYEIKTVDGATKWVWERGCGVFDHHGNLLYLEGFITDITESKEAVEEKVKLLEQLNHRSKIDALGELAGGVAHDFNNMLTGVIVSAQLLKEPERELDQDSLELVEMILQSASRTSGLTKKLLAFGRKVKVELKPFDVSTVINDTFAILEQTLDKKIRLAIVEEAKDYIVTGDSSMLHNAFLNIGINASHAMPEGGQITISTKNIRLDKRYCELSLFKLEPGDYLEVEFKDTGSGIAPENLNKIFEPFFTTKKQGKGTGLGLSMVYGTVLEHRGAIEVESQPGKGATFRFLLPCSHRVKKEEETEKELSLKGGMILLVDDEEIIRISGKYLLKKMGYDVLVAEDGREAIEILESSHIKIDLILMDLIMPNMNGYEAFIKMKEIDKDCKIIITSGSIKNENIDNLMKKGLDGFIHKPYNKLELNRLIQEVLAG